MALRIKKEERLEQLVESYKLALAIYNSLLEQGMLESDKVASKHAVISEIAATIRVSKANYYIYIDTNTETLNEQVADLYLKDLKHNGSKWGNAYLRDDILKLRDK